MQASNYPIRVYLKNYEVISSGVVHTTESEIRFDISGMQLVVKFVNDLEGPRYVGEAGEGKLTLSVYNTNNVIGEGRIEPVEIATMGNRKLYTTWFVNTIQGGLRQYIYSFMLSEG